MHSGQAILSKFPVLEQDVYVLQKPQAATFYYNAFYLGSISAKNHYPTCLQGSLTLLNVHLEAFDTETRESQAQVSNGQMVDCAG